MVRARSKATTAARKKRTRKLTKGFRLGRHNLYRQARVTLIRARKFAFRDRKAKKREYRRLWIVRINAAAREHGLSYSAFMQGIEAAGVTLDRKMLADMAVNEPASFAAIAKQAREAKALPTPRPVRAQKAVRPAKTPRVNKSAASAS